MSRFVSVAAAAALLVSASASFAAQHPSTPTPSASANEFKTQAEAKSHCPSDTVVWVNTRTHVYHAESSPQFGHTKHGAFMCRADADKTGSFRPAKHEQFSTSR
ncbi:MAG TPA: hypothetical protein VFA12_02350 [Stellaceae bacterium]|nr:hypothetical protein [Stellaceae bacterium]